MPLSANTRTALVPTLRCCTDFGGLLIEYDGNSTSHGIIMSNNNFSMQHTNALAVLLRGRASALTFHMNDCMYASNTALSAGAGVFINLTGDFGLATVSLLRLTVFNNSLAATVADGGGGIVLIAASHQTTLHVEIQDSIISFNAGTDILLCFLTLNCLSYLKQHETCSFLRRWYATCCGRRRCSRPPCRSLFIFTRYGQTWMLTAPDPTVLQYYHPCVFQTLAEACSFKSTAATAR